MLGTTMEGKEMYEGELQENVSDQRVSILLPSLFFIVPF